MMQNSVPKVPNFLSARNTHIFDSEIRHFADDCVCYREIKDTEDTLKL